MQKCFQATLAYILPERALSLFFSSVCRNNPKPKHNDRDANYVRLKLAHPPFLDHPCSAQLLLLPTDRHVGPRVGNTCRDFHRAADRSLLMSFPLAWLKWDARRQYEAAIWSWARPSDPLRTAWNLFNPGLKRIPVLSAGVK